MKKYYDASVKKQQFEEGEVLLYDPRKKCSRFSKWQVSLKGLRMVQ